MNIALIGPTGAGLGTQAQLLVSQHGLTPFSTGDMLRAALAQGTALGIMARQYMRQGELVPDELVDAMVEEWLNKADRGASLLFDGFPRTLHQTRFLDETLAGLGARLDAVVLVDAPDEILLERITGRLVCAACARSYHEHLRPPAVTGRCDACCGAVVRRADDNREVATARLRRFRRVAPPVLDHYRSSGRLVEINGSGDASTVAANLWSALSDPSRRSAGTGAPTTDVPTRPDHRGKRLLDLVLLGGPGSGKGTQAEQLRTRFTLPHLSTGDLFRAHLKDHTRLGQLAKAYMERGELVPDDVTEAMVQERLGAGDTGAGFLLDGFPRTLPQAEALDDMLRALGRTLAGVVCIDVPDEAIVERLGGRLICRACQTPYHKQFKQPHRAGVCDACGGELYQRADDNPDTIRARLRTFHAQTMPLIDYYRRAGLLQPVDGTGRVEDVTARTTAAVEAILGKLAGNG